MLLTEHWRGEALRSLGLSLSDFRDETLPVQATLLEQLDSRQESLDQCVDALRGRFGHECLARAVCLAQPELYFHPHSLNVLPVRSQ